MGGFFDDLRTGAWLTRERMRLVALAILLASLAGLAYLAITSDGLNDSYGRPLGTDFSNVYAAGAWVNDGEPAAPFDPALQHARERAIFGSETPFYGWHYPPFFLFVASALASLPYWAALALWQAATLGLYLVTVRAALSAVPGPRRQGDHLWLLLALAFPAVVVNLGHGHNGFLTAALLGGALVSLDRRPIASGVLFGLLAYKPQFGLLIPLVLAATGRWRTVTAAAATVSVLVVAATIAFGPDVWHAFLASTVFTREIVLEAGETGWQKIQSVFSWVRMWGGPVPLAYAVQGAVMLAIAGALAWLWRSNAPFPLKAGALTIATILATPYSLDYDMTVLAPAIAFLAAYGLANGFAPYERSALAALWLAPLAARSIAQWTLVPIGVSVMLVAFVLTLRRAAVDAGQSEPSLSALTH